MPWVFPNDNELASVLVVVPVVVVGVVVPQPLVTKVSESKKLKILAGRRNVVFFFIIIKNSPIQSDLSYSGYNY